MSKFEEYIKNNQNQIFDVEIEPVQWKSIESELLKQENRKIKIILKIVASIAVVLILSITIMNIDYRQDLSLKAYSEELGVIEKEYNKQIAYQHVLIKNIQVSPSTKKDLKLLYLGLDDLDKQYKVFLKHVDMYGMSEEMELKIIEYFDLKLERLIEIRDQIKKIKKYQMFKNNEKNNNKYEI
jgi:hypothetical protein